MFVFEFSYKGLWLGGKVLVVAKDISYAKKLLKRKLSTVDYNSLELIKKTEFKEDSRTTIIYDDNGDY